MIKLPEQVNKAICLLKNSGFEAYAAVLHETLYWFSDKCQRPFFVLMKFSFFSKIIFF